MSTTQGGGNISANGLILCLDAANTKSYAGTGTVWADLSRSGNNGVLTSGPTFNNLNNGSIVFDGVDEWVNISSSSDVFSSNFTLTLWYYPLTNSGDYRILFETNGYRNGSIGLAVYQFNNYFRIWRRTGVNTYLELITTSTNTVGLNTWKTCTLIRNNGVVSFYIDTNLVGSYSTDNNNYSDVRYNLGGSGPTGVLGSYWFNGRISSTLIYNRALSLSLIHI